MNKTFTVAMAAAFVMTATIGGTAAAQDEPITLEGTVWFDRNSNEQVDPGEPGLANQVAVKIRKRGSLELIGEYKTDENGHYKAENLPADTEFRVDNLNWPKYAATTAPIKFLKGGGTLDFGLRGGTVWGYSFEDANLDGVKQDGEQQHPTASGPTFHLTGNGVDLSAKIPGPDGVQRINDIPEGVYNLRVGTFFHLNRPLALAKPLAEHDADWTDYNQTVVIDNGNEVRLDARYTEALPNLAVGIDVAPVKETYAPGETVKVTATLSNKGNMPEQASFILNATGNDVQSVSDNVTRDVNMFTLKEKLLPGTSAQVVITTMFTSTEATKLEVVVTPGEVRERDRSDNIAKVDVKVAVPSTSTSSTPPTETTSTTTAPPAAGGGNTNNDSGLASTGAAPLLFLLVGGVLLGGGALTVLMARRRRA